MTDEKRSLKPLHGVLVLALAFLIGNILSFIVAMMFEAGDARTFIMYTLPQIANVVAVLIVFKIAGVNFFDMLPIRRKLDRVPLIVAPALTATTMAMSMALLYGFGYLTVLMGIESSVTIPSWTSPVNVVFGIICLAMLPAIGEELLFRGALLKSLQPLGGKAAILLSALLFAVQHMSTAQLVHQFILGALLSFLVLKTNNIWYGVIIHFLNNVAAQALNLCDGLNNFLSVYSVENFFILVGVSAVGAILTGLLLFFISKSAGGKFKLEKGNKPDMKDVIPVFGAVAVYLFIWIVMAVA